MKTIFISFENYQELHELTLLVKAIKEDYPSWVFILFDTTQIYGLDSNGLEPYLGLYTVVIKGKNKFNISFKLLSAAKKIQLTFLNTLNILKIFKVYGVDMMITGVPLVFFRYASFFRKDIFNIAYMRALIIGHSIEHSFSNRLDTKIKRIPFLKSIPFFDSWYCNLLVTVSEINSKYYLDRGMNPDKIKFSGSLLLDSIENKIEKNEHFQQEIIFLTYAAGWHDNEQAHIEQINVIKKILSLQNLYNFNLTIRVHPRDNKDEYYPLIANNDTVKLDTSHIVDFLQSCSKNKVVVSAFSTLNFEWNYLGGEGYFFTTQNLYSTYVNFYKELEINPYFNIEEMISDVCNHMGRENGEDIYKKNKEGNINYFKELIYGELCNA